MNRIFFLFLVLSTFVYAQISLKNVYYVTSDEINISVLNTSIKKDIILFNIEKNRYTKRIKSKELLKLLASYGYENFTAHSRFVKFIKKSPVDLGKVKAQIHNFYRQHYNEINIKSLLITPRGYVTNLPKKYEVHIPKKSYLYNHGTFFIESGGNQKIFFDYLIQAEVKAYVAKHNIKRDIELSAANVTKKSIILKKFKATVLQTLKKELYQTKQSIKRGTVVTMRDIKTLDLIRKGSYVNVSLHNDNIVIEFIAKALHNAKLGELTTLQRTDGKKIKAIVIGKNKAEIQ